MSSAFEKRLKRLGGTRPPSRDATGRGVLRGLSKPGTKLVVGIKAGEAGQRPNEAPPARQSLGGGGTKSGEKAT